MHDGLALLNVNGFVRRLGPRWQIGLSQLPLALIMAVLAFSAPTFHPELLESKLFLLSLVLHMGILVLSFTLPWHRFPSSSFVAVPLFDFVAIAISREGASGILPGLGLLAVFPVIWLSASGTAPKTSILLSFLGPFFIVVPPVLRRFPNVTATDLTSILLFPLMMLIVSLAIHSASVNLRLQRRKLTEQDRRLRTALRESNEREEQLNAILDAIDVGLVVVDVQGNPVLKNRQQRQFDLLSNPDRTHDGAAQALVFGEDKRTLLPPERLPIRRAIRGETYNSQLVWLGEQQGQRAVSVAARAMTDKRGKFSGSVIIFKDVTDFVEAIAAKDDFVASVSHEFQTPLTSILGHLELVLDAEGQLPVGVGPQLEIIRRNAERLRALVSDLLITASGSMNVHPRRTDLAELVETSMGSARVLAKKAGIAMSQEVQRPLWTHADPTRMAQVLDNLISNAIKYSPQGGTVTARACADNGRVKLEVQDTGMGMTPDESAAVFAKFFRSSKAREAGIPGVGLGLSVTKTIVENHGGTIWCTSEPGIGTTFTVELPSGRPGDVQAS